MLSILGNWIMMPLIKKGKTEVANLRGEIMRIQAHCKCIMKGPGKRTASAQRRVGAREARVRGGCSQMEPVMGSDLRAGFDPYSSNPLPLLYLEF